jgi:hypothetical protein
MRFHRPTYKGVDIKFLALRVVLETGPRLGSIIGPSGGFLKILSSAVPIRDLSVERQFLAFDAKLFRLQAVLRSL